MYVEKDIFDKVNIGDYVWQYYFDGEPKIGKSFIRGKKISTKDDRFSLSFLDGNSDKEDNEIKYILTLSKTFGHSETPLLYNEKEALKAFIDGMTEYKETVNIKLDSICKTLDNIQTNFDNISQGSLETATRDSADGMMCMIDMLSDESSNFNIDVSQIPTIDFSVGDTVFVAYSISSSDIYGQKPSNYKIIEDNIKEIEVMFRRDDDIEVYYKTFYESMYHMRDGKIFNTKKEAEDFCRDDFTQKVDNLQSTMDNMEFEVFRDTPS